MVMMEEGIEVRRTSAKLSLSGESAPWLADQSAGIHSLVVIKYDTPHATPNNSY